MQIKRCIVVSTLYENGKIYASEKGAFDRIGSLYTGKAANMLILDKEYNVKEVIFQG